MALGDIHKQSDFDVIVGAKFNRLYTARFFCLAIYKLLGWRRKIKITRDGFCFNHFITERAYRLKPPYNIYWQELYANLAPIFGDHKKIVEFFDDNAQWIKNINSNSQCSITDKIINDLRFQYKKSSQTKIILERLLSGKLGDRLDNFFKSYQIKKIEKFLRKYPPGHKPRIIYTDEEVELHLDTRRLETIKNKRYV